MKLTRTPSRALLFVLALAPTSLALQQRPSVDELPLVDFPSPERPARRSAALAAPYSAANLRVVPAPDVAALRAEDERDIGGPARIGVVLELDPIDSADGPWYELPDGGRLWVHALRAAGARGVRLRLPGWNPPPGAELTLHSADDREARGPLTARQAPRSQTLWSHTIYSDHVRLEYYLPPGVEPDDEEARLRVDALVYQYAGPGRPAPSAGGPTAGGPLPCHLDWSCYSGWSTTGQGVAGLSFVTSGSSFFCSSGLLNRIPEDLAPLLMTAWHCGVTDSNADSLQVNWFYQTPSCGGTPPDPSTLPITLGCTVLVNKTSTDWTLIGLQDQLPGGVTYLGWSSTYFEDDQSVVGIHHPRGSFKRISFGTKDGDVGNRPNPDGSATCIAGNGYQVTWTSGLVEPGSSGSPLFHPATKRVIGTLSCASWTCSGTNTSSYGRLDQSWSALRPYLDPVDPVYADAGHGGAEEGTSSEPFDSITEAAFAVIEGSTIHADPGTYDEEPKIDRAMTILCTSLTSSVVIR